jgi:integrase/recombinase XerD
VRKKLRLSPAQFVRAPERIERLPWIPAKPQITTVLESLPKDTATAKRNYILVQMILETGLSVAELCSLQWEDLQGTKIQVLGKRARELKLSKELTGELKVWRKIAKGKFLFPGFNRHGLHTERMTPRGVELVFHSLAKQFALKDMKPKTLRHYAILRWLESEMKEAEILRRLGVNPAYPLEAYRKFLHG